MSISQVSFNDTFDFELIQIDILHLKELSGKTEISTNPFGSKIQTLFECYQRDQF